MATIFYPPTIDFNMLKQRPQQLMSEAAKRGHKVIYCNKTVDEKRAEEVEPNLFVYHNPVVAIKRNPDIDILYYTWASTMNYINFINPKQSIFDNVDNFKVYESDDKEAIKISNKVIVASEPLYKLRKEERDDIFLVRNGCDASFSGLKYDRPKEYGDKKVILFSGAIGEWCDVALMEKIPSTYQLVIVGQPFGKAAPKNATLIKSVPHDKLMPYIAHADCCILPFDGSDISKYSCPIKTYEYLQFGKPVVSTRIPESEFLAETYPVFISDSHNEFIGNIQKALKTSVDDIVKESIKKEHSWSSRWDQIETILF